MMVKGPNGEGDTFDLFCGSFGVFRGKLFWGDWVLLVWIGLGLFLVFGFFSDCINFSLKFLWGITSHVLRQPGCLRGWAGEQDVSRCPPARRAAQPRGRESRGPRSRPAAGRHCHLLRAPRHWRPRPPAAPRGPEAAPGTRSDGSGRHRGQTVRRMLRMLRMQRVRMMLSTPHSVASVHPAALKTVSNTDRFRATGFLSFPSPQLLILPAPAF